MNDDALLTIRRPGARLLVLIFWLNIPVLYIAALFTGSANAGLTAGLGILLCIIPTLLVFGAGRVDAPTRLIIGLTAASFPALFLYPFEGHPWQMDLHMYFFAALAALAVLCDTRAILAGAGLIAAHHLLFNYIAPHWVFSGEGDLPRVLLHAAIVVMQTAVLLWLTSRLATLIIQTAQEAKTSEGLRIEADDARAKSDAALIALELAQVDAERQRITEEAIRTAAEAAERRRLAADAIEARLGAIVAELGRMASELSISKARLIGSLKGTVARTDDLCSSHARAEDDVRAMAADTERLVASILEVGRTATEARETALAGTRATTDLSPKVVTLATTVESASTILKLISAIATKSSLLSLNARIEAAREGADGRGFAVVASEIKVLAAQTAQATCQIEEQLEDIRTAVLSVSGAIIVASDSVQSIDQSASKIANVVQQQIAATTEIATASEQMAQHIALASGEADALSHAIDAMRDAVEQTDRIASAVSDRSLELNHTVRSVLSELRAA